MKIGVSKDLLQGRDDGGEIEGVTEDPYLEWGDVDIESLLKTSEESGESPKLQEEEGGEPGALLTSKGNVGGGHGSKDLGAISYTRTDGPLCPSQHLGEQVSSQQNEEVRGQARARSVTLETPKTTTEEVTPTRPAGRLAAFLSAEGAGGSSGRDKLMAPTTQTANLPCDVSSLSLQNPLSCAIPSPPPPAH